MSMKRLLPLLLLLLGAAARPAAKPNILWLIAEDFGPHLGCYGTKEVWTPNLDQLAKDGVRYTRFFTTAPVCSPSRSAFMTGMYQTTIGAHNHRSHRDDDYPLPDGVKLISHRMHDAGYFTANIVEMPKESGFKGTGKNDWNFTEPKNSWDGKRWDELKDRQPFFAQVNFQETHRKYHAPAKADPDKVEIPPYYPDHPVTRKDWAQYLDSTTELDRKVGVILKQLEADGLAGNTIVVFHGDHGASHVRAKQFCYDTGFITPLIIRRPGVPGGKVDARLLMAIDLAPTFLSIAGVEVPESLQGKVLFDAAREYVFGARDRCDETVFRFRTVRDARYRYIRNFTPERPFLQANKYKENSYPVWNLLKDLHAQGKLTPEQDVLCGPTMPAEELYDLDADPHEVKNLAALPEQQALRDRLSRVLEKWIEESNDQGRTFEPEDVQKRAGATKPK